MGSEDQLAPGSMFAGTFRIVELVGHGEMGEAYLVDPLALPRSNRCVLKAMDASLAKHDVFRATFAAHAKLTWRIASPHVLQTLDAGIDAATGRPWYTANFLGGEDLASRVGRWGRQPLSEVRALVAALGDALGKAHHEGFVHYDLTPENVHLGAGEPSRITLRELMIACLVSDACAAEGDIVGSPLWMPPEQFELGKALAPAANVWSLGLLAFYAATGKPYWLQAAVGPAPSRALLREVLMDPIAGASARAEALGCGGALPAWFDAWFARCVTRDPGRRFPDATSAGESFAEAFRAGAYHLAEDPEDYEDDQRTTIPLPPEAPQPRGSRRLSPLVVAEARRGPAVMSSVPPPAVTAAGAPANLAGSRERVVRILRYGGALTAAAAAVACFALLRHRGAEPAPTTALNASPPPPLEAAPGGAVTPVRPLPIATDAAAPSVSEVTAAPAVKDVPDSQGEFDLAAALKGLNGIHYGVCAIPTAGKIAITFAPSGRVKKVEVLRGNYGEQARRCIAARFSAASVPPFQGSAQAVTADLQATR